jgi:hypothetical protein
MVILFVLQLTLIYLSVYFLNKEKHKKVEIFIQTVKKNALFERNHLKCKTSVFGAARNTNLYFNQCDLYLTHKALIIVGNPQFNIFNQSFSPIVLSKEPTIIPAGYIIAEPITDIYRNRNKDLTLKFGNIFKAEVEISLSGLKEEKSNMIESILISEQ